MLSGNGLFYTAYKLGEPRRNTKEGAGVTICLFQHHAASVDNFPDTGATVLKGQSRAMIALEL